jgi:secreted PhoX family phosphatase
MGRHNHENSVAIPGFTNLVMLSGDDTFTSNPPQSQLYAYIAPNTNAVWNDTGELYGFKADDTAINDYYDFPVGSAMSVPGTFVKINKTDAVGNQTVLENASDALGVFQFVRLEDIAYDKRPGMSNVIYIADTGRGLAPVPPATSAPPGSSTNGRIWKLVLDPSDPTKGSLSVFVEGDDDQVKAPNEIHQPDNLETTRNGLYVTEDPGSSQQFPFGSTDPAATTGRVWKVALDGLSKDVVLKVDQGADEGPTDVDPSGRGNLGAWEASGIIDASAAFGPGWFFVDVQAHSLWVQKDETSAPDLSGPGNVPDGVPDWTYKREGGQLLLVHIQGG